MIQRSIYVFVGTTAELIKLVPVLRELNKNRVKFTIIASGQNDIRFEEFITEIGKVDILYAITPKSRESSLFLFGFWAIKAFFSLLIGMKKHFRGLDKSNSYFIVHGDTVSSLMGSLVASLYGLNLVHIESGLRSFNFFEPFPEELCRYVISRIADIHFCPNSWAVGNLSHVSGIKIDTNQNTLIETFQSAIATKSYHPLVVKLKKEKLKYYVLVTHRQEHVLFGKKKTARILEQILSQAPKTLQCVFLVHDLSSNFIATLGKTLPQEISKRILRIERLPYGDFMHLVHGSEFMITDGGSNQEELYYMGKPCLLLRNATERIEGLGENVVLSNNSPVKILDFIKSYKKRVRKKIALEIPPSRIIVDYLTSYEIPK